MQNERRSRAEQVLLADAGAPGVNKNPAGRVPMVGPFLGQVGFYHIQSKISNKPLDGWNFLDMSKKPSRKWNPSCRVGPSKKLSDSLRSMIIPLYLHDQLNEHLPSMMARNCHFGRGLAAFCFEQSVHLPWKLQGVPSAKVANPFGCLTRNRGMEYPQNGW